MNPSNLLLSCVNRPQRWSSRTRERSKSSRVRRSAPCLSRHFRSSPALARHRACSTKSSSSWETTTLESREGGTSASRSLGTGSWRWSTRSKTSLSSARLTGTQAWSAGTSSSCSGGSLRARASSPSLLGQSWRSTGRTGRSSIPTLKPRVQWKSLLTFTSSLEAKTTTTTNGRAEEQLSRSTLRSRPRTKWSPLLMHEWTTTAKCWPVLLCFSLVARTSLTFNQTNSTT